MNGAVYAAQETAIRAACELGRRLVYERRQRRRQIIGAACVFEIYAPVLADRQVEELHAGILDAHHRLVRDVLITIGTLSQFFRHPREIFREAIAENAHAIVLVHNHPSGDPSPIANEREVMEQFVAAGELIGVPVVDHVIVGHSSYWSLVESSGCHQRR